MKQLVSAAIATSALALAPLSAQAATVLGSSFLFGSNTYNAGTVATGVTATFTGSGGDGGKFEEKAKTDSTNTQWRGVGIKGGTAGEIDIGESILGTFTGAGGVIVGAFNLMVLYDGSEFSDVQEKAKVTATTVGGATLTGYLEVIFDSASNPALSTWTGTGFGTLSNLSLPREQDAAVWRVLNPFGSTALTSLKFEAVTGSFGTSPSTNQTDYAVERIEFADVPQQIPEPSTYVMMLAGLAMLGFMVRRRAQS